MSSPIVSELTSEAIYREVMKKQAPAPAHDCRPDTCSPMCMTARVCLRSHFQACVQALVAAAGQAGLVVTVEQVPERPLAMGNYRSVVSVRPARGRS